MSDSATIKKILASYHQVAVVGLSANPARISHSATAVIMAHGYNVTPVNPRYDEVFGKACYPDLISVPHPIEVVNLFQRSENVEPFVEQAIAIGAKAIWMQLGIVNLQVAAKARAAGLDVVMDRCMKVELLRSESNY